MDFEDFSREVVGDILIEKVNFSRATFKEAGLFRDRLVFDILKDNLKIIIDLSSCEYIDSTFLGALVVSLKKLTATNGDLRLVGFQPAVHSMFELTRMYRVFESFKSKDEAVASFK